MTEQSTPTRRGFLAAVGASALAGCSGLDGSRDGSETTVSMYHLRDVTEDGESDPIVVESVPVPIEQSLLDERLRRVSALLQRVPTPLDRERIPNGVIRERLLRAADDASTSSQRARSARTRLSALQALSRARERARYAAAGWAYVAENRRVSALRSARRRAVDDARALRSTLAYRGDDPIRAALVYARLERNLDVALDDSTLHVNESSPLLTVAAWGEHAETARALADDTRYLHDQYTDSLSGDAPDVEDTLAAAAETLATRLRDRRAELPPEPTESGDGLGGRLRYRLRDDAESSVQRVSEPDGPARAVVAAVAAISNFEAYDQVRTRLAEDGADAYRIADASEVRERRARALRAIRRALDESPRPALVRPALADAAMAVSLADESLARHSGDVRASRLDDPVRRYVAAAARARNAPAACRAVIEAVGA
ncbi:hypothetical protein J2754_001325 [Halarchaeum solikamskense]|uniref:hypothetical protein n=1 Tax=Halarchaeum nitratireducens TaxID=489913 RepID=UPI001B3AD4F3|nr:hypothetical protein [Halarchaeum solikamskense]MBP2251004.1 hypothetical protein [Halarchaeum solikamskense]